MTGLPAKLRDLAFDWRIRRIKRRLGLFPLIACNQTGAADLAICGSTHPGYLDAMGQPARLSDRWKIALEHAHLSKAQAVVAHSRRMADEAQRYHGVPAARIHLLYPPVDGRIFSPVDPAERRRLREQFGLPHDRAVFLLASTGHKRKGLDLLVEFFRSTALPVSLAVAGRPIAVRAPNIHYLGYRKDIENVYRAVDFTIVASNYEPFGLVGVESVLCGTPVLIAEGVGCAEVIRRTSPVALRPTGRRQPRCGRRRGAGALAGRNGPARISSPIPWLRSIGFGARRCAACDRARAVGGSLSPVCLLCGTVQVQRYHRVAARPAACKLADFDGPSATSRVLHERARALPRPLRAGAGAGSRIARHQRLGARPVQRLRVHRRRPPARPGRRSGLPRATCSRCRPASFDTVISAECFEHNPFWRETLANMLRMTRPGGLVLVSCATTGRKEHGTSRTNPDASPFTVQQKWDYYRNLRARDLERGVNLAGWLADWHSWVNYISCDLYFVGLRHGGTAALDAALVQRLTARYAINASARALRRGLKTKLFGDLRSGP